jgi:hypothetical protein
MKKWLIPLLMLCLLLTSCSLPRRRIPTTIPEGEAETEAPEETVEETTPVESDETQEASAETIQQVANPEIQAGAWMELPEEVLFFDNFQSGNTDRWQVGFGWVVQQDGNVYTFDTVQPGLSYVMGGGGWQNYILRGQVFLEEGTMAMSLYLSPEGRYLLAYNTDGLYILKEVFDTGEITALARADAPALGEWHWMGIAVMDGQIQAGTDSILLMEVTDPNPLTGGTVAVGAGEGCAVRVDNIVVTQLDEPLVTASEQTLTEEIEVPQEISLAIEEPLPDLPAPEAEPVEETQETEEAEEAQEPSGADLYVNGVSIPKPWVMGEPLNVTINITNNGPSDAGAFTVVWFPASDGVVGGSWDVDGLAAGEGTSLSFEYPGYAQAGSVTWQVVADTENEVNDLKPQNNTRSGSMTIEQPEDQRPSADLAAYWGEDSPPITGEIYNIHFVVENYGPDTSEAFNVEWYPFDNGIVGGSWEVMPLAAGANVILTLAFDGYVDPGEVTWSLSIDPIHESNDPNWDNNTFSNTLIIQ